MVLWLPVPDRDMYGGVHVIQRKWLIVMLVVVLSAVLAGNVLAQDMPPLPGEVVVGELQQPRGLSFGPDGSLVVVEGGAGGSLVLMESEEGSITAGMAWSVSSVADDGTKTPLLLLPSANAGPEALSAYRAYWHNDSWWVIMSGGAPGQPPWNPLSATVLQLDATGRILNTIDTWAFEAANNPDGTEELNSNPGDVAWLSDGTMLITDSGANALLSWTEADGLQLVHAWGNVVPTSIAVAADDSYYIGFLGEGIAPGAGAVEHWVDGELAHTYSGLTGVTDVELGGDGTLYAVQIFLFGEDPAAGPGPGSIVSLAEDGSATPVVEGLPLAHSMAIGEDGSIYVTVFTAGFMGPTPGMVLRVGM